MAEQANETSKSDDQDELEQEQRDDTTQWAIRGAVVGAVAGSTVGAAVGMFLARRPEALKQAKDAIGGSGTEIARAAALAATEVVTSRRLSRLMTGNGNGDRSQMVKETAKEAGAAAAKAARDSIVSLRQEGSGSK